MQSLPLLKIRAMFYVIVNKIIKLKDCRGKWISFKQVDCYTFCIPLFELKLTFIVIIIK